MGIFNKKKPKPVEDTRLVKIEKKVTTTEKEEGKTVDITYTLWQRNKYGERYSSWDVRTVMNEAQYLAMVEEVVKDFTVNNLAGIISKLHEQNSTKVMFRRYAPLEVTS